MQKDLLLVLNQMVPWQADYRHLEGNSPAHAKSTLAGASQTIAVANGHLVLGTWQGIFSANSTARAAARCRCACWKEGSGNHELGDG